MFRVLKHVFFPSPIKEEGKETLFSPYLQETENGER